MRAAPERGMTLVEITVVMVLAGLVLAGLTSFYVSMQALWLDGSAQTLTQRDGTFLVSVISDSVRCAQSAEVRSFPDAEHEILYLYDGGIDAYRCFYWRDSLVYMGAAGPATGDRLLVPSLVGRFQLSTSDSGLVSLDLLELPCPDGRVLRFRSAAALYNR